MGSKEHNGMDYSQLIAELAIIYGGKCVECGNPDLLILHFHHVDGGGTKIRKREPGRDTLDTILTDCKELGKPKDGIVLLCGHCHAKSTSDARSRVLTSERTASVLNISAGELNRLVESRLIEPAGGGQRHEPYTFTPQSILDYVFSGKVSAEEIQKRALSKKKDAGRQERGRKNRLGKAERRNQES